MKEIKYRVIYEYEYLKQNISTIKSLELFSTKKVGLILIPEQLISILNNSNVEYFVNEMINLRQRIDELDYFEEIRFCNISSKKSLDKLKLLERRLEEKIYYSNNFYKFENAIYGWDFEQYELIAINLIAEHPIKKIVIFRSARDYHIERVFKLLNEYFKETKCYLVVQKGFYNSLNNIFETEKKVIIPDGFFNIFTTGIKLYKSLRGINPDLLIVPYMNVGGEGYFQLDLFSVFAPAKFKYSFNANGELSPIKISLETTLVSGLRIILTWIICFTIKFVTIPYHKIKKRRKDPC